MKLLKCFAIFCLTCFFALPSLAAERILILENKTSNDIGAAVRYYSGGKWYTRGWYTVAPNESSRLDFDTTNRYMYVYGRGSHGEWSGEKNDKDDVSHYVVDEVFTVTDELTPKGSGREAVIFDMIDFEDYSEFFYTFTD